MKKLSAQEALHKAAALCSKSEYGSGEIDDKLSVWGISTTDRKTIIERLTGERFIDDERFARVFANDKLRFNRWGKIKISYALRQKKVASEHIQKALDQLNTEQYEQTLAALIKEKAKTLTDEDDYQRKNKIYRFVLSRGFEPELISRLLHFELS